MKIPPIISDYSRFKTSNMPAIVAIFNDDFLLCLFHLIGEFLCETSSHLVRLGFFQS